MSIKIADNIDKKENLAELENEITYEEVCNTLRKLNIVPSIFFKRVLNRIAEEKIDQHRLRKWLFRDSVQ
jgi:hypothetical protein